MTDLDTSSLSKRPEFRNIHAFKDLPGYRLPLAGIVSILHRISGALLFALLPFIIWMFDVSISSEISFARFVDLFDRGLALSRDGSGRVPGWFFKLVALSLIWAYLHHLFAGLRHLWMDVRLDVSKEFGKTSAAVTLVMSVALTLALGAKLFGMY
ncbi:MAG: succinate:quinone oxidoreductase subunit C [Burkholderiaceae bacterium]